MENSMKIFISHSSKDIKYVKALVKLLCDIGVTERDLFCSSIAGFGIPLGENIYEYLEKEFKNNNLLVIFILSDNYYKSAACLNEMGAAWVLKKEYYSILLPGFNFTNIEGAIDPRKIAIKLGQDSYEFKDCLAQLREVIIKSLNLKKLSETRWEQSRDNFIKEVN